MCGIAGEFVFDTKGQVDESVIVPMVSAIRHRGPDQWGYYLGCSGSVLLINTRLSIVDLSNGRQPLSNEDGSIWVVLNGELYGFQDIAMDLDAANSLSPFWTRGMRSCISSVTVSASSLCSIPG
jgi:asparagine synthase (glutamine-hydrolysing)